MLYILSDSMRNDKLDERILTLLHVLVDHRINVTMEEPARSMILHVFKKFRTTRDIEKILEKYEQYMKSQGY